MVVHLKEGGSSRWCIDLFDYEDGTFGVHRLNCDTEVTYYGEYDSYDEAYKAWLYAVDLAESQEKSFAGDAGVWASFSKRWKKLREKFQKPIGDDWSENLFK
jgi:hypothetical protein